MNEDDRADLAKLRMMESASAADWLLRELPRSTENWARAVRLLAHLSWKKADQYRLARAHLVGLPHGSAIVYKAFASVMSLDALLEVLREQIGAMERTPEKLNLLRYYLAPTLSAYRTNPDNDAAVDELLAEIGS